MVKHFSLQIYMFTVVQRNCLSTNFLEEPALKKSCGMQNLLLSSSLNSEIFALEMNLEKKDETCSERNGYVHVSGISVSNQY